MQQGGQIWVQKRIKYNSQVKVLKNGLKSRDFGRGGVHRSGWWISLFCVFDAADRMAVGTKLYYHAKIVVWPKEIIKSVTIFDNTLIKKAMDDPQIRDIEKCLFQIISLFLIQVMGMVNENIWMFYTIYLTSQINYSKIYRNKQLRKTQV